MAIALFQGTDFFLYKVFAPKYENVRREVYENTDSYIAGHNQDLVKFRLEYMREKDPAGRTAIQMTIVQEFANFDESKIKDPELRGFLHQMKTKVD